MRNLTEQEIRGSHGIRITGLIKKTGLEKEHLDALKDAGIIVISYVMVADAVRLWEDDDDIHIPGD